MPSARGPENSEQRHGQSNLTFEADKDGRSIAGCQIRGKGKAFLMNYKLSQKLGLHPQAGVNDQKQRAAESRASQSSSRILKPVCLKFGQPRSEEHTSALQSRF